MFWVYTTNFADVPRVFEFTQRILQTCHVFLSLHNEFRRHSTCLWVYTKNFADMPRVYEFTQRISLACHMFLSLHKEFCRHTTCFWVYTKNFADMPRISKFTQRMSQACPSLLLRDVENILAAWCRKVTLLHSPQCLYGKDDIFKSQPCSNLKFVNWQISVIGRNTYAYRCI
jgi:hypothetical protein